MTGTIASMLLSQFYDPCCYCHRSCVSWGNAANSLLPNGVQVQVTSTLNDPSNGDNLISIIFTVPWGRVFPRETEHRTYRVQR